MGIENHGDCQGGVWLPDCHPIPWETAAAIERMGTAVQRGRMNLFSAGGALAGEGPQSRLESVAYPVGTNSRVNSDAGVAGAGGGGGGGAAAAAASAAAAAAAAAAADDGAGANSNANAGADADDDGDCDE